MLTPQQITFLREELATAKNPLFFFDDDPDGLCSFLLLYRLHREGHGIVIKALPKIDQRFLRKAEEYHPDKIFILDIPLVEQEFIDAVKAQVFWLDHHQPVERQGAHYFNPRLSQPELYMPVAEMAYQVSQNPADLWLAMVGCLGDYRLPPFLPDFLEKYPNLIQHPQDAEKILYQDPFGQLVRVFSFLLKGKTSEVNRCLKILTRLGSPEEILNQSTPPGKYIFRRYEEVNKKYLPLLEKAKKIKTKEKVLLFVYTEQNWSFTSELASELLYLHPDKIIIVARQKSGELKGSLRSKKIPINKPLERALIGIDGYGGGHEFACGINIKEQDWGQFLENFGREIK